MGIENGEQPGSEDFSFSKSEAANSELSQSLKDIEQALIEIEEQIREAGAQLEAEHSMMGALPGSDREKVTARIDRLNERLLELGDFKEKLEEIQARTIQTQDKLQTEERKLLDAILTPTTEPNPDDKL